MKFFTREWHAGSIPDAEANKVIADYAAHLDALLVNMPATVSVLARSINLHDGLIRNVSFDRSDHKLEIAMRCGDLQVGYFDIDLFYSNVDVGATDLAGLDSGTGDIGVEALYDEVDRHAEKWVHRILFWPYREACIVFGELGIHLDPRKDRNIAEDHE
jgi:hypothetical protein